MTLPVPDITVDDFCSTLLLLQFIDVCGHSFMYSSLKAAPQHFIQVEIQTLTGPLASPSFFSVSAILLYANVLGILDLLHDPVIPKL